MDNSDIWEKIKAEWENGRKSCRQLSNEYNIPKSTIHYRLKKDRIYKAKTTNYFAKLLTKNKPLSLTTARKDVKLAEWSSKYPEVANDVYIAMGERSVDKGKHGCSIHAAYVIFKKILKEKGLPL